MTGLRDLCHGILLGLLLVIWGSLGWPLGMFIDWLFNLGVK